MQSMDEIYQTYARTVYRYILSLTHNSELAEELTQETFYQAIKRVERYDGSCKVSTWLCAIAKNQLLSYWRKHPASQELEECQQTTPSTEQEVMDSVNKVELLKCLHACPEPFREVLYLRIFGTLSFREIGDIMGQTENWARVTFYRGKKRVEKEMLNNDEKDTL